MIHHSLTNESNNLIHMLYMSYPEYMQSYKPTNNDSYSVFYRYMYDLIRKHSNHSFTIVQPSNIIPPYDNLLQGEYTPYVFTSFIYNKIKYQYTTVVTLYGVNVRIIVSSDRSIDSSTLNRKINRFVTSMSICLEHKCDRMSRDVTIYVYENPLGKDIYSDTNILGPLNVNSGISYVDGGKSSVIFRAQESLKVFLHEVLHLTGYGPHRMDASISKKLRKIIPINSSVSGEEIYVEILARIINCGYISYENCNESYDMFRNIIDRCIYIETIFACCQTKKILNHNGITHLKLDKDAMSSYKEDSNVFAYYIATASLFVSKEFIPWMVTHNNGLKFNLNNETMNSYISILKRALNSKKFYNLCNSVKIHKSFGLRMSVIELK